MPAFRRTAIQSMSSRGARPLAQALHRADRVEDLERLGDEPLRDVGVMHGDDAAHQLRLGEVDEVEDAAPEEGVGQVLLVVARDDHDRAFGRDDLLVGLEDAEAHAVELVQEVVRELDVCLVDLVDEQHLSLLCREGLAEGAEADVVTNVVHVPVAEARVVEPLHRVVDVEPVLGARRALDVPAQEGPPERLRHGLRQERLARPGLAAHEQGTLEHQGAVDGCFEGLVRQVGIGAAEAEEGLAHGLRGLTAGWRASSCPGAGAGRARSRARA